MKKLLTICLLITSLTAKSQAKLDTLTGEIFLEEVHEIDLSKENIRKFTNSWIAKNYNDSKEVIKLNNENNIIVKGLFKSGATMNSYGIDVYIDDYFDHIIDIKFKEKRYKIIINDITSKNSKFAPFNNYSIPYDEYKENQLKALEEYNGFGKKRMIRDINDDEKNRVVFDALNKFGKEIVREIFNQLNDIDKDLYNYLLKAKKSSDW